MRTFMMLALWAWAHYSKADTPKDKMDQSWLETFALLMILFFVVLHSLAYFPSIVYGGFAECFGALRGGVSNAYQNMRDYHYCAALMLFIVVMYPIINFFELIVAGFDPYKGLT